MYVARGTDGGCWGDGTGCCGDKVLLNTNALLVMGDTVMMNVTN